MGVAGKLKGKDDLIFEWLEQKKEQQWIADQLGCTPQAISNWKKTHTQLKLKKKKGKNR